MSGLIYFSLASDLDNAFELVKQNLSYAQQTVVTRACKHKSLFLIQEVGVNKAGFGSRAVQGRKAHRIGAKNQLLGAKEAQGISHTKPDEEVEQGLFAGTRFHPKAAHLGVWHSIFYLLVQSAAVFFTHKNFERT